MSRMGGSIGRYGLAQPQDSSAAANPTLGPDPRYSGISGISPFDPRYALGQAQNSPLLRKGFLRPANQTPAPMQTGANPQYQAALKAQQQRDASSQLTAAAAAWRQKNVNGGNGPYAIGPNGHALGAGSNVGQNGFGTFGGMAGSGQVSNANRDVSGAPGGRSGAGAGYRAGLGGAGSGPGGGAGGSAAGGTLQGLLDQTNQANEGRYNQLLGMAGQLSDAQMKREGLRRDWQLGRVDQQAVTSGLAGTNILPNLERGVVDDSALRENEISDAGLRAQMGIVEGRSDQPPNLGLYAGLLSQAGAGGAGGYGGGPMLGGGVGGSRPNTTITQPIGPDSSSYGGGGAGGGGGGRGGLGGATRGPVPNSLLDGPPDSWNQNVASAGGDFNAGGGAGRATQPGYVDSLWMQGAGGAIGAAAGRMGGGLGWSWGVDPRRY